MRKINPEIEKVILFGDGAKNRTWMRILSEVLDLETVVMDNMELTAIGAAVQACIYSKIFKDGFDAISSIGLDSGSLISRKKDNASKYRQIYKDYISTKEKIM